MNDIVTMRYGDKYYLHSAFSGAYLETDLNVYEMLKNCTDLEIKEKYKNLYGTLFDFGFFRNINSINDLYLVVSDRVVWNNDTVYYIFNGFQKNKAISADEYALLEKCVEPIKVEALFRLFDKRTVVSTIKFLLKFNCIILLPNTLLKEKDDQIQMMKLVEFNHPQIGNISNEQYYCSISKQKTHNQFDIKETTIAYLLRNDTNILEGDSYGKAVIKRILPLLTKKENKVLKILEIGAGLGHMARSIVTHLNELKIQYTYDIVDLAESLIDIQKKVLDDNKVRFHNCNCENFCEGKFDIIICNEVIADLSCERNDSLSVEGKEYVSRYKIDISQEKEYINLGAFKAIENIYNMLNEGGVAFVSEYKENDGLAKISNMMNDHMEVSVNFTNIISVAQQNGFHVNYISLQDFLNIQDWRVLTDSSLFNFINIYDMPKLYYTEDDVMRINTSEIKNFCFRSIYEDTIFFDVLIMRKQQ